MTASAASLRDQYLAVRQQTQNLIKALSPEDMVPQSMPDASPIKWHLGHTTWFFETFLLRNHVPQYTLFDDSFPHLFNSYYESAGTRYARPQRGLLTRPALEEVMRYRARVDDEMLHLLARENSDIDSLVTVGLHHEMQHQELMLTDLLHLMSHNPTFPTAFGDAVKISPTRSGGRTPEGPIKLDMIVREDNLIRVGALSDEFSYDCERPSHKTYLGPHALANRLVTNGEWLQFMADNGYKEPLLWLSDGWVLCKSEGWEAPLYWVEKEGEWFQFGLDGLQKIDINAPVCHISYFEAEAFARWAGKRLPREHELEHAASAEAITGNFVEQEQWRPKEAQGSAGEIHQLYGDVWEWTQSAYLPYPKFSPENGALGEYNGKFMVNQFVLKGGSCATPTLQMRSSYRNFFYPHQRWQFSGVRLAEDL